MTEKTIQAPQDKDNWKSLGELARKLAEGAKK